MRATSESAEWIFLATGLGLEILSAACDQASSPRTPQYALFGMLFAIAAVLISIWELIYRGKKERVVLRRWGMLWWFYHTPPPRHTPFGTLPDIYGLAAGISQCICSIVQYVYCLRHANSPFKASLLPAIFLMCLGGSKLCNNRMNANTTDNKDSWENSPSTEETSWQAIKVDLPFLYDQEVEGNIEQHRLQEQRRQPQEQQQLLEMWLQEQHEQYEQYEQQKERRRRELQRLQEQQERLQELQRRLELEQEQEQQKFLRHRRVVKAD
ncbi:PREDICTED: serine/threonine-kinase protein CCR3 [Prunus dulcis]|uniref:PREDICTED: serine/threonine-kinase protein CCR3 n=1 Tax=Prunus dulcis TaxID=3755 RepID=A0A5E4EN42_PRUDU|nr:protein DDB_G0276689-like isoform X2 [Prunus dulcis]VVA17117.1 PREDICTED: serine/threonine-kinase protein CCR3 [Prunus dulcis]